MSVVAAFVLAYLIASLAIGLYAARRVHSVADFAVAGRRLPLHMTIATVFATWFGAETVLGISATFLKDNLRGIVSDPFGASVCLILVALFFARRLYRLNLLTIGDYFRQRYNRVVEVLLSVCIVIGYLGWTAAQVIALGLVFSVLSGDAITMTQGMLLGMAIVLVYTLAGGMWSVALTDFFQMVIIIIGLAYIAWVATDRAGGLSVVMAHAHTAGKFEFLPRPEPASVLAFIGAAITLMLGSIPQQDTYQRVMSARDENTAVRGALLGGLCYLGFAFVPMTIAYAATLIDPAMVERLMATDSQRILPTLVLEHMAPLAQVFFFGALLAAIMSSASGALLAPAVSLAENVVRVFARDMTDARLLRVTRACVVWFALAVLVVALFSNASIFKMVENAYKITLVSAFVPLVAGLFWRRASSAGALAAVIMGLCTWLVLEAFAPEGLVPPNLAGLLASAMGMLLGSLLLPGKHRLVG